MLYLEEKDKASCYQRSGIQTSGNLYIARFRRHQTIGMHLTQSSVSGQPCLKTILANLILWSPSVVIVLIIIV